LQTFLGGKKILNCRLRKKEIKKKTGKKAVTKEIKKEIFHLVPPSAQAAPPARYGFVSFHSDTEKYSSASVSAPLFFLLFSFCILGVADLKCRSIQPTLPSTIAWFCFQMSCII
jgi:hypothetical protein